MSLTIDLRNLLEGNADNFTVQLMSLIRKADGLNKARLATQWPVEVEMMIIYHGDDCPYLSNVDGTKGYCTPNYEEIERMARERVEQREEARA